MIVFDPHYKAPEGFKAMRRYTAENLEGDIVRNQFRFSVQNDSDLEFAVNDDSEVPVLPLRTHGELKHIGWELPTVYAIDALGRCYMSNSHNSIMILINELNLVEVAETEDSKNRIRHVLGKKPVYPQWAKTAQEHGWTPPQNWNLDDYED